MFEHKQLPTILGALTLVCTSWLACSKEDAQSQQADGRRPSGKQGASSSHTGGPPGAGGPGEGRPAAAVPVEVSKVVRRSISSYIETNGTLEAENEVDLVARVTAPVVELTVEEGMQVDKGQILARLDDSELRARAEISRATLEEAEQVFGRAESLKENQLISPEEYDQVVTRLETARAQSESDRIQLGYTEIRAPFAGLVVTRYIHFAEQVNSGMPLFRISDFNPLLCPIQIPERDIPKVRIGQQAYLTLEAWPEERFPAKVLRIRPVVDAATGTVRVTLEVETKGRLSPGMFARVFVQTETRSEAMVIPRSALSLESIGDTVYVAQGEIASRRDVELGFKEGDSVEVLSGVSEGEQIVVVGQDGLSDGTPIQILSGLGDDPAAEPETASSGSERRPASGDMPRGPDGRPDFSRMTPEQLERVKESMRSRGMSDEQIEERIRGAGGKAAQKSE